MDFQALFDAMSAADRQTRSRYHLTLGDLIAELSKIVGSTVVKFDHGANPGEFHSYRGYYADLSLSNGEAEQSASSLLNQAHAALGTEFYGYKGGDFLMGSDTPMWSAEYGCCGRAIVGCDLRDGVAVLATKDMDA